jgi:hypothetical protein
MNSIIDILKADQENRRDLALSSIDSLFNEDYFQSGCDISATTIDVMLYQYSAFLSITVPLLAETLTAPLMGSRRSVRFEQP